jgi:CheY-like chemotaxis protein
LTAIPLILCVDDEAIGLQIRKAVLERAGYHVVTALTGAAGLGLFAQHSVDAVILDYSMPDMNGDQVAAAMRKSRATVPILLLSAYVDLPLEVISSVNFTLTKDDGPATLIEKVHEMLALSRPATEDPR